jgi:hypothetical protein
VIVLASADGACDKAMMPARPASASDLKEIEWFIEHIPYLKTRGKIGARALLYVSVP